MAEPSASSGKSSSGLPIAPSPFPEEHVAPPIVYQRISGCAIAGFALGVAFALLLGILIAWGLRDQEPVLLPIYIQLLPVIGAGLALAALLFISKSEGTLAGRKLANWGLGICLVGALGYWAYSAALSFAISDQAETFTRAWFQKILEGDLNAAFLDTQDPAARQKINPRDTKQINMRFAMSLQAGPEGQQRGPLATFREKDIVRVLRQGGPTTQIKSKGVREWSFMEKGYRVQQMFQITTDDADYDVQVTVHGLESQTREFEGRRWFVVYNQSGTKAQRLTQLGENERGLHKQSAKFINRWGEQLANGDLVLAYADTQEPSARRRLQSQFGAQLVVFGLAASSGVSFPFLNLEAAREWHRAEFHALFDKAALVKKDRFEFEDEATRDAVLAGVDHMFGSPKPGPSLYRLQAGNESAVETYRYDEKTRRLLLPHDCKIGFYTTGGSPHQYDVQAIVTVESDPGPLDANRQAEWRIIRLELLDARDLSKQSEAGMMRGMMGRGMRKLGPDPSLPPPK